MDDRFLDAMVQESMKMMDSACNGEPLTKEKINFIIYTQKLSQANAKKQVIPNLLKGSSNMLPLLTSFLGGGLLGE